MGRGVGSWAQFSRGPEGGGQPSREEPAGPGEVFPGNQFHHGLAHPNVPQVPSQVDPNPEGPLCLKTVHGGP